LESKTRVVKERGGKSKEGMCGRACTKGTTMFVLTTIVRSSKFAGGHGKGKRVLLDNGGRRLLREQHPRTTCGTTVKISYENREHRMTKSVEEGR